MSRARQADSVARAPPWEQVHRLDKPVSGLLLFARHAASADALRQKIEASCIIRLPAFAVQR